MLKTWRQWMKLGRQDKAQGLPPQFPSQPDYMAGYDSENPTPIKQIATRATKGDKLC